MLFKQVHQEKALKGRANDAVAAACLYIACRQEEVPRSFKGKTSGGCGLGYTCRRDCLMCMTTSVILKQIFNHCLLVRCRIFNL